MKVNDHCDLTANYRSAVHHSCNIKVKKGQPSFVPVLLHNFTNNGSDLVIKTLLSDSPNYINCKPLPVTVENIV